MLVPPRSLFKDWLQFYLPSWRIATPLDWSERAERNTILPAPGLGSVVKTPLITNMSLGNYPFYNVFRDLSFRVTGAYSHCIIRGTNLSYTDSSPRHQQDPILKLCESIPQWTTSKVQIATMKIKMNHGTWEMGELSEQQMGYIHGINYFT